ncbi:hypothetical protein [Thiothrix subterranea]|uniref:HPt domain-containing protein n=1 Tax=Thiothrix subterranea TaxID=2735563 RepID=A0ABU0Y251_9GAMM|nr:hypothetical protein [Thiothrix subterranea]MDQ5766902.1 hypothetical protein [Thiothrix subterranea]
MLTTQLTPQQLRVLLRKFRPALDSDYALLEQHLCQQHWEDAARQAHKLLAISKLLGMDALLLLLLQIEAMSPSTQTVTFRHTLQQTYQEQLTSFTLR